MLSSPGPPSAASLCSLTRFFFCRGVQSRPTLVVLCKTQPRGRDVTPIEGEAQGTMCVCTHSDVYPWCLFFFFFLTRFVPAQEADRAAASQHTMTHSSAHVYAPSVKRTQMCRREHVEDKTQSCRFACL